MHTVYLSDQEVDAYLLDLVERLTALGDDAPSVLVGIGASGAILTRRLVTVAPQLGDREVLLVDYNRADDRITYIKADPVAKLPGKRVLLIDGTVHSGNTLLRVMRDVEKHKPLALSSYALVVRRGARVIPNHFGVLVGDHDRALFLRRSFPNNRLKPYGIWRKIAESDMTKPMISTGRDFIDREHWSDYWYEGRTDPRRQTYLYEVAGEICGFISFRMGDGSKIVVDNIGVDKSKQDCRVGGHLMRWAEHLARHGTCARMELWAIDDRVPWYQKMGYEVVPNEELQLENDKFLLMTKKLLYNLPDDDVLCMTH